MLAAIISEFVASNDSSLNDDNGNSTDWIEIYNSGTQAVDLTGYRLTDSPSNSSKFVFQSGSLNPGEFLVVFAGDDEDPTSGTDLYTGFSLGAGGDYLALTDDTGTILSEFNPAGADYPDQYTDVSYGVILSGNFDQTSYFATPTPGQTNTGAVAGVLDRVYSDVAAGFYDSTFQVTLSTPSPSTQIRYTLDGSTPTASHGSLYTAPISISSTQNLRAVATRNNYLSVPARTWSYLFLDDILDQSNNGAPPPGWPTIQNAGDTNNPGGYPIDYGIDPDVRNIEGDQAIRDALLAIPTWSITTDLDNLFDEDDGIYYNAQQRGDDWERAASVEKIDSGDGTGGFQVNAGLRIKGAYSRRPENPKHSFKLYFRNEYGDSDLNYPIHGDEGVDYFKKLDLRTAQNWSWSFNGSNRNAFVLDEMNRINQQKLGQPSTLSTWFHLYLNGQYWGLYQTQERHDSNFGASYFGGEPDDYDVIKSESGRAAATDGNLEAYHRLYDQAVATLSDGVTPAFADYANYMKAQGLNADGTRNPDYEVLLDVDSLIAYMMLTLDGGNLDGPIGSYSNNRSLNNFFILRNRNSDEGFRYFIHDAEHTYINVNVDRNGPWVDPRFETASYFNPQTLHQRLMANEEYRTAFGDAVQKNYFNGGLLTPEVQTALLDEMASEIDLAVIAESARWGDSKRNSPQLRQTWLNALDDLRNNWFPARHNIVLEQYKNTTQLLKVNGSYSLSIDSPLFPSVAAPSYLLDGSLQNGGDANEGSQLTFANQSGLVYYTTDGSDPRLVGGGINPNAIEFNPGTTESTLFTTGDLWKYHDQGVNLGTAWRASSFNDSSWAEGPSQLGYGDGDEATEVSYGPDATDKQPTTYFRKTFNVSAGAYTAASLQVKRDDGIVVYLNGAEIGRDNLNGAAVTYNTFASPYAMDDGNDWHTITFDPGLLNVGDNTLAIEIHQVSGTSSDLSFDARLIVAAQSSSSLPVTLDDTTRILSRSSDGGTWSALQDATFVIGAIPAAPASLKVTEINYNPSDSGAEFIELWNSSTGPTAATLDLAGVQLTDGPSTPFVIGEGKILRPGEYGVLVSDEIAFRAAYPSVDPAIILGDFAGGLSNSGERVKLIAANGDEIVDVEYKDGDPFSVAADGAGASLVLKDPLNTPANLTGKYYSWTGSSTFDGTPGTGESQTPSVVINEILANSDGAISDSIELYNPTSDPVDVSGWYLSDAGGNLLKFEIPDGTIVGTGEYVVFDESDFNPTPSTPAPNHFALGASNGDEVYLVIPDGSGGVSEFVDSIEFGASFNNQSFGRIPDGGARLGPLKENTFGKFNGSVDVGPVLISEVNYHPADPSNAALAILPTLTASDLEFVEIHNPGVDAVSLTNWRLRGEVDFDFVAGTGIAGGQTALLVSFAPTDTAMASAFRAHYGIGSGVPLLGAFSGKLSNSFGRVELQRPDTPPVDNPTLIPRVTSDEVLYDDLAPWPTSADGMGDSLQRIDANGFGNSSLSWQGSTPTPGAVSFEVITPVVNAMVRDLGDQGRPDLLDRIAFRFSTDVAVAKEHLKVYNDTLGGTDVDLSDVTFDYDKSTYTATWYFSAMPAPMEAAFYSFEVSDAITTAQGGLRLDGDSNGTAGGMALNQVYVAIPGDTNLDGVVTLSIPNLFTRINTGDVATARRNVGVANPTWADGDFNNDGIVTLSVPNLFTRINTGDVAVARAHVGRDVRPTGAAGFAEFAVETIPSVSLVSATAAAEIISPVAETALQVAVPQSPAPQLLASQLSALRLSALQLSAPTTQKSESLIWAPAAIDVNLGLTAAVEISPISPPPVEAPLHLASAESTTRVVQAVEQNPISEDTTEPTAMATSSAIAGASSLDEIFATPLDDEAFDIF